uniref:FYVE-type domain-containing protein n=1 Tax=Electrophorus electricus TaxID=8005 RepID=A0AAY5ETK6_ELEEL
MLLRSCAQGFICPQCMKSHNSAEELFKHYGIFHELNIRGRPSLVCCVITCWFCFQGGLNSIATGGAGPAGLTEGSHAAQMSVSVVRFFPGFIVYATQTLQLCTLQEERWFSEELKKELDKVQGQLKQLEMKLHQAETETFNIKQMKDLFEQKAAQLATEIVDIKSRYDEERSLRELAEQRLANVQEELQRERQEKDRLSTELLQRPGLEDVEVLKTELVQVQTLMDNMTREREAESAQLKTQYERLQANFTTSETTISGLRAELEKGPQETAVYTQQIHQLQQKNQLLSEKLAQREKENQEVEKRLSQEQTSKKSLQASLHQRDLELQESQARASAGEAALGRARAEGAERGEEAGRLRRELAELEKVQQELKAERKQLQHQREERESQGLQQQSQISQLHAKLLEAERQLGEVQGRMKEQRQLSGEKLKDREQQVAEVQLKLSRLEEQLKETTTRSTDLQQQLDKSKQQHQELQALQQSTNGKLREAQNDLEQVLRQIGDKDQKIQNLEALLQKSKASLGQLEAEREDLCAKIQAGEGEAALLSQLQEKNHALHEQISQLTDKMRNQSESHKQAQENLHEQLQEQKSQGRSVQDRCQTLEGVVADLTSQLTQSKERVAQLDTQLKAKTEMLLSAEAANTTQRADLENHLETAQNALQDKQQVLGQLKKLQEQQLQCSQLDTSLKETREQLLFAEQRTDTLETQVKKAEAELAELHSAQEQAQMERQRQQEQLSEMNTKNTELSRLLDTERQGSLDQAGEQSRALQTRLEQKLQGLGAELQKACQQAETQAHELSSAKESLSRTAAALEVSQAQLEKEKKRSCVALEEKVRAGISVHWPKSCSNQLHTSDSSKQNHVCSVRAVMMDYPFSVSVFVCVCVCVCQVEDLAKLQQQLAALSAELSSEKTHSAELQKTCDSTKQNLVQLQSDYYGRESELSALRQDLKACEEKLALTQEELKASTNQLTSRDSLIQELKTGSEVLEKELTRRAETVRQQDDALRMLQGQQVTQEELKKHLAQVEELKVVQGELEKERDRLSSELKALASKSTKELKELQAARQVLLQQKVELQGRVEAGQATLEQEQRDHQSTRDTITHTQQQHRVEMDKLRSQLEEEEKRGEEACARLSVQVSALNENVATLKREWQGSQRRVAELEKQTDELRGEIAVLEATVQNNQDERRALLERCVKGEGEIEKLQNKVMELKRKLDDTTAAMQELGRENQSLQIKQSQSLTRKWAEDHEVQNCMACGKGFSVTIRKHHCRHCGNIFCAECSSRNALTPSSKKAVRVCEPCYEELQG